MRHDWNNTKLLGFFLCNGVDKVGFVDWSEGFTWSETFTSTTGYQCCFWLFDKLEIAWN